jgi:hypothetical protein
MHAGASPGDASSPSGAALEPIENKRLALAANVWNDASM